jgi:hypothetical protein
METPGWLLALSARRRSLLSTYYYNKWQRGWLMLGWFCGAPALFQPPQLSQPHLRMLALFLSHSLSLSLGTLLFNTRLFTATWLPCASSHDDF